MELFSYKIQALNAFAADYLDLKENTIGLFDYAWNDKESLLKRSSYLSERELPRVEIANYIEDYMEKYGLTDESRANIEKLRNGALVVVGGQQAGLLTGPMYTLNKVISIVQLARKQAEIIGKPVVPVFWVAGEDHDFYEINHVFTKKGSRIDKKVFPYKPKTKEMVSDMLLNKEETLKWVRDVFVEIGETEYSSKLIGIIDDFVEKSKTVSEFFGYTINFLFKNEGILLVDSGDTELRKLASGTYVDIINNSYEIENLLACGQKRISDFGYKNALELGENSANLFYYNQKNKNRILLEREGESFVGKSGNVKFSREELLEIAVKSPENLSSNVVTRTLVQERLFPVLSFVAGPGEIAYWAEIAPVFELFGERVPLVVPRISFTIMEARVEKLLGELKLNLDDVFSRGCSKEKREFLESLKNPNVEDFYRKIVNEFLESHNSWEDAVGSGAPDMEKLFDKNRSLIQGQLDFMKTKIEQDFERKHVEITRKYDEIENTLRPFGGMQERILNPMYFINCYGSDWISELCNTNLSFEDNHYIVKIQ